MLIGEEWVWSQADVDLNIHSLHLSINKETETQTLHHLTTVASVSSSVSMAPHLENYYENYIRSLTLNRRLEYFLAHARHIEI
jgi:hypothetical protein